ncbi:MAG: hypothetical protein ACHQX3_05955 [Nitrospirales bacterium]
MKIIVKKQHIDNARKKDSHHCMIADSLKEMGVQFILVDTQSIRYSDPDTKERLVFMTPPTAQEMILRWDRGIQIQPFAFELGKPVIIKPMRKRWTGKKSVLKKARAKYDAKRRDPMAPRLVKKNLREKPKVTRFREFGVRRLTKTKVHA